MGFFSKLLGIDEGANNIAVEMIELIGNFSVLTDDMTTFVKYGSIYAPLRHPHERVATGEFISETNSNIKYRVEFNEMNKEVRLYFILKLSGLCPAYLIYSKVKNEITTSLYDEEQLIGSQLDIINAWLKNGIRRKV